MAADLSGNPECPCGGAPAQAEGSCGVRRPGEGFVPWGAAFPQVVGHLSRAWPFAYPPGYVGSALRRRPWRVARAATESGPYVPMAMCVTSDPVVADGGPACRPPPWWLPAPQGGRSAGSRRRGWGKCVPASGGVWGGRLAPALLVILIVIVIVIDAGTSIDQDHEHDQDHEADAAPPLPTRWVGTPQTPSAGAGGPARPRRGGRCRRPRPWRRPRRQPAR